VDDGMWMVVVAAAAPGATFIDRREGWRSLGSIYIMPYHLHQVGSIEQEAIRSSSRVSLLALFRGPEMLLLIKDTMDAGKC